jgi:hypothetical protein
MSWGVYGILIVFAALIVLMIVNPNLSCFGRRIKSPFYPLLRKRRARTRAAAHPLKPGERPAGKADAAGQRTAADKADDYGFKLD